MINMSIVMDGTMLIVTIAIFIILRGLLLLESL